MNAAPPPHEAPIPYENDPWWSSSRDRRRGMFAIDPDCVNVSPSWVIDLAGLEENLKLLRHVADASGGKVLLALKGFAAWSTFDLVRKYLDGATSSAVHEAMLAREKIGNDGRKEVHAYAPAYSESDMSQMLTLCDHIVFNSLTQWSRYKPMVSNADRLVSCGLRVNPEHREVSVALYDPCAPGSRLGVTKEELFKNINLFDGLEGLHFHTLCELGSDALQRTLEVFEAKFAPLMPRLKWVNFGGGHHVTKPGYDVERLISLIQGFKKKYPNITVYIEPGEAIAIRTGVLVTTVLDIVHNGGPIAILDTSATAHMPDVLEMPYRPEILGAGVPGAFAHTYRLGGLTCLAGDVIGDYSFPKPLEVGQKLVFLDMSHYTMVKTSNFNGVRLPALTLRNQDGTYRLVKEFGYEIYRDRLS
jgi:carboxynorspermidine decarboxylase